MNSKSVICDGEKFNLKLHETYKILNYFVGTLTECLMHSVLIYASVKGTFSFCEAKLEFGRR